MPGLTASSAILVLNSGSSSLKFALFQGGQSGQPVLAAKGQIEGIGIAPHLIARDQAGMVLTEQRWSDAAKQTHEDFLIGLLDWVDAHLGQAVLVAAGHRVVHGGIAFAAPVRISDPVLAALELLSPLAPLHQPHNLAAIRAVAALRPGLPQIACFDTGFHHGIDPVISRFGLPYRLAEESGIRRYGFHGLSYEFVSAGLAAIAPDLQRVIMAHLGNGASLCATKAGRSVDTTMGFTALDGLVMGTRSGAIDPGVILYLQQSLGFSAAAVETLLYKQSGLLGVSGISSDMRELLASPDPRAKQAIDLFVFRITREIGALTASLGGLDALVFTAGIGENSPEIRALVTARLGWLGAELDPAANQAGRGRISTDTSRVQIWVMPTDEEAMIAQHSADLLFHLPA